MEEKKEKKEMTEEQKAAKKLSQMKTNMKKKIKEAGGRYLNNKDDDKMKLLIAKGFIDEVEQLNEEERQVITGFIYASALENEAKKVKAERLKKAKEASK